MSIILMCHKIVERSIKPKVSTIINGLKIHTFNGLKKPILKANTGSIASKRLLFNFFKRRGKNELKILDNIPDHFVLIHRNTMERYILYTQIGTCVAVAIVAIICMFPIGSPKGEMKFLGEQEHVPRSTENELQIYIAIFATVVILLQVMISKMPLRIYYCCKQKKYILIFPANIPFSYNRMTCNVGDVKKLPLQGVLPWKDAQYTVKDKRVILIDDHFRRPADLWVMMGVQRDPDSEE